MYRLRCAFALLMLSMLAGPVSAQENQTAPAKCAPGAVVYNCSHVYYHPYYQGTTLVYQVVTYP